MLYESIYRYSFDFAASSIQAESIADDFERDEVNHFQLLVNNLNMLYLSVKDFDKKNGKRRMSQERSIQNLKAITKIGFL